MFDAHREQPGGRDTLSVTLIDAAGDGSLFDVIRTDQAQYTFLVQCHREQR